MSVGQLTSVERALCAVVEITNQWLALLSHQDDWYSALHARGTLQSTTCHSWRQLRSPTTRERPTMGTERIKACRSCPPFLQLAKSILTVVRMCYSITHPSLSSSALCWIELLSSVSILRKIASFTNFNKVFYIVMMRSDSTRN